MDTPSALRSLSPLQHQCLQPDQPSDHTKALLFCKRIDRIEVRSSSKLDGHTHFVVEVFVKNPHSNIPTLQKVQASRNAIPNATLYRRFSSFVNLRHEAYFHASNGHTTSGVCGYCATMIQHLYNGPTAPRLHMKLFHGNASIGLVLEGFFNSLLHLTRTLATAPSARACDGQFEIPLLLQKFLRESEDKLQAEPVDPTPQGSRKTNPWAI